MDQPLKRARVFVLMFRLPADDLRMRDLEDKDGSTMAELTFAEKGVGGGGNPQPSEGDAERLEQVRDLLFGQQVSGIDRRIAALELKVTADAAAMFDEIRLRLDTLETTLLQEIEGLEKTFEDRLAKLGRQHEKSEADLRKQLREQSDNFAAAIQRSERESSELIQSSNAELTHAKLDRKEFSRILIEAAERVASDSESESPQVA